MTTSFINVIIGIVLGNIGHVAIKDPTSSASPTKFSMLFFLKDNWVKLVHSLVIACLLNVALQVNLKELEAALGFKWYNIYAIGIGLFPDATLSFFKNRFGWMQPNVVKLKGQVFNRKDK